MLKTPVDPVADRRPSQLVMVGFRTTIEQRDAINAEAKRRKVLPSSLIRSVLAAFLRSAR